MVRQSRPELLTSTAELWETCGIICPHCFKILCIVISYPSGIQNCHVSPRLQPAYQWHAPVVHKYSLKDLVLTHFLCKLWQEHSCVVLKIESFLHIIHLSKVLVLQESADLSFLFGTSITPCCFQNLMSMPFLWCCNPVKALILLIPSQEWFRYNMIFIDIIGSNIWFHVGCLVMFDLEIQ